METAGKKIDDAAHHLLDQHHTGQANNSNSAKPTMTAEQSRQHSKNQSEQQHRTLACTSPHIVHSLLCLLTVLHWSAQSALNMPLSWQVSVYWSLAEWATSAVTLSSNSYWPVPRSLYSTSKAQTNTQQSNPISCDTVELGHSSSNQSSPALTVSTLTCSPDV